MHSFRKMFVCEHSGLFALVTLLFCLAFLAMPQRALAQRPLGIDVYSGDGTITWSTVKNSGVQFAWAKCSEGASFADSAFVNNEVNAKNAGVLIGAYHYARYDLNTGLSGADKEANWFWSQAKSYIKGGGAYLMPMLDVEQGPGTSYTKTTLSQWVNRWCQDVVNLGASNGVVIRPVVYTFISFANSWLDNTTTNWPLWMANIYYTSAQAQTGAPSSISPWSHWSLWQYNWTNSVPGVPGAGGECDQDVFNGTLAQLRSSLVIGLITNEPASLTVWQGSNATFTVGAPAITHYQWTFNGTIIPSATTSSYTITNVQVANAGRYAVNVTNSSGGFDTSTPAFLSVLPNLTDAPGSIIAPAGMVNWWPADGNCADIFGPNTGTPQGNFYYAPGKSGEAFHFDGSTTYISTGAANLPVPWTASMWVNYSYTPQTSAGLLEDGSAYALKLEQYNGTHQIGLTILGVGDYVFTPAYSVPQNTWTHLVFVGTSSGTTLYVNGVQKASLANSVPLPRAYIGGGYVSSSAKAVDFMNGNLDELMIFNRALSQAEISSIYNASSAGLVRTPHVTSAIVNTNNQFVMNFKGFTGKNFTLYYSTNLVDWSSVATLSSANGTNSYTVSTKVGSPQKFYRISQPY